MAGGTERYVRDLARAQAGYGLDVWVVTLCRDVTGTLPGHLAHDDRDGLVKIVRLPGIGTRRVAQCARPDTLIRILLAATAIHLHDLRFAFAEAIFAARVRRVPVFLHTHGLLFHTSSMERLKSLALRYYFSPLLRRVPGLVLASSQADVLQLTGHAPGLAPKIRPFPNAIDLSSLLAATPTRRPGDLLVHGRIARTKRLERAIDALAALNRPDVRLSFAGAPEPGEVERLREFARVRGVAEQVRFLGAYGDGQLPELLGNLDAAVFPSPGEGFGLALLEALAAGVPVVANDIPAHREVLGSDLARRLTDFNDANTTAEAIAAVLDLKDPAWRELGEAGRRRARHFDLDTRVDELWQVYRESGVCAP